MIDDFMLSFLKLLSDGITAGFGIYGLFSKEDIMNSTTLVRVIEGVQLADIEISSARGRDFIGAT